MILNEFQKEHRQLEAEQVLNRDPGEKLAALRRQLDVQGEQLAQVDALRTKLENLERLTEALAAKGMAPASAAQVTHWTSIADRNLASAQ